MTEQPKENSVKNESPATMESLQKEVDDFVQEIGGYWSPFAMFLSVAEEVGEVARQINHIEKVKIKKPTESKKGLEEEMGDTLFSLICIANYYKIDLAESLRFVIEKYRKRDANRYN